MRNAARPPERLSAADTREMVDDTAACVIDGLFGAGAHFRVLPGAGRVPMIDDPELASRTILAVTTAPAG